MYVYICFVTGTYTSMELNLPSGQNPDKLAFYISEYRKTLDQLDHINNMIDILNEESKDLKWDVKVSKNLLGTVAASSFDHAMPSEPGKRGRKSKWGNFILHRLMQAKRPLSYDDILKDSIRVFGLDTKAKLEGAKKVIFSTSFRLKEKEDVVRTFGVKGRRGKYLALKSWCTPGGKLKKEYALKITSEYQKVV